MRGSEHFTGVVLAGGAATRMGGINKALIKHNGRPLYQYAVENLSDWCCDIVINTNRDAAEFVRAGFQVAGDGSFEGGGPLAGVHAGLSHATTAFVAFAACDQLLLPDEVYETLCNAVTTERGAYACSDSDQVPTCAVLPVQAVTEARTRLASDRRALIPFMQSVATAIQFDDTEFGNLNFRHQVQSE